jgi:Flp pilus assembly protein TadD
MAGITDTLIDLAGAAFERGDMPEAEALFRRALAAGRNNVEVLHFLGFIARGKGDLADAGNFYAAALARSPTDAQLHNNLADVRRAQKRDAEALALYRRAASLAPEQGEIHANLGALLMALRRPDEALPCLLRALELRPDLLPVRNDAAMALSALGRYPEVVAQYSAVIRQQPANADARYLEALALLATGDFARGWRRHEARFYAELGRVKRREFDVPQWLGDDDLHGRCILLHAEQGYGDTLQFLRYVPMVAALGGRILLEVQPPLQPLLQHFPGTAGVFAREQALPPFDLQCSLMSLPRAFRTTLQSMPATVPYLTVPPEHARRWAARLQQGTGPGAGQGTGQGTGHGTGQGTGHGTGRRHVALAWRGSQGGPWNRDIPLPALRPLLQRADCVFHIAQVDLTSEDRALLAEHPAVIDHSAALADFADTAALLAQMDLVITCDTALAHLAGALGRPVWTLLPLGADYRWMMQRDDSPWYPTMRLFRQAALRDWDGVVAAVGAALDAAAGPGNGPGAGPDAGGA